MLLVATIMDKAAHRFEYDATATSASAIWVTIPPFIPGTWDPEPLRTPRFKPDETVLEIWREMARKCLGVEVEFSFVEAEY